MSVCSSKTKRAAPDGCGRLECHSHNDVFPIADAALNATASIGGGAEAALFLDECVVVCRSPHFHSLESTADLEAFGRGDREHGVSELSLKFVEAWLPQSDRAVADDACHDAASRVLGITARDDLILHCCHHACFVWTAHQRLVDVRAGQRAGLEISGGSDSPNATHPSNDIHPVLGLQNFFSDRARCDAADRLPRTAPATATAGLDSVLVLIRDISVTRTGNLFDFFVVARPLILIWHGESNWRSQRHPTLCSRHDSHRIDFVPRGCQRALSWTTTRQLRLNVALGQRERGRNAIDNTPNPFTV
mmetsp:Transcript_39590/g.85709  ORF Transcript_39590/g.85709 Transcript_39590/m.85709 type:complete len:305 (+) Transcript_39590:261-1175(+)